MNKAFTRANGGYFDKTRIQHFFSDLTLFGKYRPPGVHSVIIYNIDSQVNKVCPNLWLVHHTVNVQQNPLHLTLVLPSWVKMTRGNFLSFFVCLCSDSRVRKKQGNSDCGVLHLYVYFFLGLFCEKNAQKKKSLLALLGR